MPTNIDRREPTTKEVERVQCNIRRRPGRPQAGDLRLRRTRGERRQRDAI